jgi:NTE family protein
MANLFDSYGLHPKSLDDVLKRYKDIMYSSRYRSQIQSFRKELKLQNAIHFLYDKLPDDLKHDPAIKKIHDDLGGKMATMHFVRFLYTAPLTELSSKDYEFSKFSIDKRFAAGYQDGLIAVKQSPWKSVIKEKVAIHEICSHPTLLDMIDKDNQLKQMERSEFTEKEEITLD